MRMVNINGPFYSKKLAEGFPKRMRKGYKKVKVVRKAEPFACFSWYVHCELGR